MTSTDAMDTEEGDGMTKMILEKTRSKVGKRQRRSDSLRGWDLEIYDPPRLLSIPPPDTKGKGEVLRE